MLAVAFDDDADAVRPWVEGITYPVLLDPQHVLTELYAISNVPTVVWIDEQEQIVRPNTVAFGTDLFQEFTGVASGPHLDAVRAWVRDGVPPAPPTETTSVGDLADADVRARLHFRIGAEARRQGDGATARRHLEEAGRLAPHDFTIRRAALPLLGGDPFGEEFFAFYEEWEAAGSPYNGDSGRAADG